MNRKRLRLFVHVESLENLINVFDRFSAISNHKGLGIAP